MRMPVFGIFPMRALLYTLYTSTALVHDELLLEPRGASYYRHHPEVPNPYEDAGIPTQPRKRAESPGQRRPAGLPVHGADRKASTRKRHSSTPMDKPRASAARGSNQTRGGGRSWLAPSGPPSDVAARVIGAKYFCLVDSTHGQCPHAIALRPSRSCEATATGKCTARDR